MSDNAAVSELYRDSIYQIRADKEFDYDNLERIHSRFDFFKNPDNMHNKPKSMYDLKDEQYETCDDILSTELSDMETNELYRRYKTIMNDNKDDLDKLKLKEDKIATAMKE
jgi:hypothetical protein